MKSYWYKDAVFYQIYPRSFKDSNGDGIGDLRGIISRLDYLKDLGIDAVWLSPCFKSPNDDNGYDISDYRDIMDEFGTLDDWKEMIAEMHKRDIRLVMDLVANHSSDEHPWFVESRKSKDNPYRDYYIWRDKPNRWRACFGGSAWQYDETTDQYYLHLFSKKQPDLNWANPKVRQEVADTCDYWFDLGVDGFRCDVITYVSKYFDPKNSRKDINTIGPDWQDYINELAKKSWDKYDSMIVGECCGVNVKNAPSIHGDGKSLLDSVISFDHLPHFRHYSLPAWKKKITGWQSLPSDCWWSVYLENHDQQRSVSRFIKKGYEKEGAKLLASVMMFLRGTPYIYQGQEIGMTNIRLKPDEFKDIQSVNLLNAHKNPIKFFNYRHLLKRARDHARTPMQWTDEKNAGFTTGEPWMKVNPNYTSVNAEDELKDPDSVLNFYKRLIAVRKNHTDIIKSAEYKEYFNKNKRLFCYSRGSEGKKVLVIGNFSDKTAKFRLPETISFAESELVISNNPQAEATLNDCRLNPYEARVYLLKQ